MKTSEVNSKSGELSVHTKVKERSFWLDKLSGDILKTCFPYDDPKEGKNKPVLKTLTFAFPDELFLKLMRLSNNSDIRLYIILMTGVVLLLNKYTESKDIVVGAPIYRQDMEGDYVNKIVVLRNRLNEDMSFKELLLQVSQTNFEAVENINYPLETIPYELDMPFDENEFPLFDVALLLENLHDKSYIDHLNTRVVFSFSKNENAVGGVVEYNSLLYKKETVERIVSHLQNLMQRALDDIDIKIADISVMSDEEAGRLLRDLNDTHAEYPRQKTIHQLFQEQVERTPRQTAVQYGENRLTYAQLNENANGLALRLKGGGVDTETIVAILLDHSPGLVTAILAVLKAGGAYLPIDPGYPAARIDYFLEDSNTRHLITAGQPADTPGFTGTVIHPEHLEPCPDNPPGSPGHPDSIAYLIYTSGTTSNPKGVMIRHSSVVNYVWWAAGTYLKDEKLNFPLYSSISFDLTVTSLFTPLITGNTVVVYRSEDKNLLIEQVVEENKVGVIKLTPSHLYVIKHLDTENSGVKCFIVGGENFESRIAREISEKYGGNVELYNEYGPTEATVGCLIYKFDREKDNNPSVPIGTPIAGTKVYILDSNRRPVPVGVSGEIYVSGEGIAGGYLNSPDLTSERFVDNPFEPGKHMYKTGDLARWLPGENIEFLGRRDHQVKIRGYRIELTEIEHQLLLHTDVQDAVVIARDPEEKTGGDEKPDQYLCAYFVSHGEVRDSELRDYLVNRLPDYMMPLFFVQLEEIPLTSNGKTDRKALPVPELKKEHNYVAPRDKIEEKLVDIWSEVLRLDHSIIGIDGSFFELGGQSLKQVYLISQIHKEFNVKVPLAEIFKRQTIRELSEYIKGAVKEEYISIEPVEEKEYFALSSVQKRLYVLRWMSAEDTLYNVPFLVMLGQEIDRERAENAFQKLIRRHGSLRTSFHMLENKPVQKVSKSVDFKIEYHDLPENGGSVEEILDQFIRPFDLAEAPLFRVGLIKLEREKYLLLLDIHHIISDGVSMEIIARDYTRFYSSDEGESLPEMRIQYKDYAEWQNSEPVKDWLKRQEEYWINEFKGDIPVLDIHPDYPRPAVMSSRGRVVNFEIGKDETTRLRDLALEHRLTLYMIIIGAFNILLSKLSNQDDIVIGTPVAARRHAELEQVIGMFVNTLVLRNYPRGEKKIIEFLHDAKEKTLKAFENQEYQYEDLLDVIDVRRDVSRNPLFDVMFAWFTMFRNTSVESAIGFPVEDNPYKYKRQVAKFDLNWAGMEKGDGLAFEVEYCIELFKEETILRFVDYFKRIISIILESPQMKISHMEIISGEEKERILYEFNDTHREYPRDKTIHELFEEQVERSPGCPAIVGSSALTAHESQLQFTYRQLNEKSNRFARLLRQKGVKANTIVGVMAQRCVETVVGILGILKAGGAYLPIDPDYPAGRIESMLAAPDLSCLLTSSGLLKDSSLQSIARDREFLLIELEELEGRLGEQPGENLQPLSGPEDLIYVIFTSGSTGNPKGAGVFHRGFTNLMYWFTDEFGFNPDDGNLLFTSLSFDLSMKNLYASLITGGTLYLSSQNYFEPRSLIREISNFKVSWINCTPGMLYKIVEYEEQGETKGLTSLRYVFLGGELISMPPLINWLESVECRARIVNTYGPTECTDTCTAFRVEGPRQYLEAAIPIGKPSYNVQLYVLNEEFYPLPTGVPGELLIAGDCVGPGYINDRELTAKRFKTISDSERLRTAPVKFYKSGDLVRQLPDGNIEFLGRVDTQVKIRGFRVELEEIEHHLLKHDDIKEVVVMVKSANDGVQRIYAYLVSGKEFSVTELKSFLAGMLPPYMVPSSFIRLDKIPLTAGGKIDRKALDAYGTRVETGEEFVAPQNEIEKRTAGIWKELLQLDKVGINDNFFDLGGTSLDLIKLNTKLNKEFDINEPLMILFRYTTIHSFAQYYLKRGDAGKKGRAVPDLDEVKKSRMDQRNKRRGRINVVN